MWKSVRLLFVVWQDQISHKRNAHETHSKQDNGSNDMGSIGTAPHPRKYSIDGTRIEQQRHRADKQQPGKGEGYSSSRYRQQRGVPTCVKDRVYANHCKQNYPNDKQNIPRKTQPIRNSRKQLSYVRFYQTFRLDRRRHTPLAGSGNRLFMRHHTSPNTFAAYINAHIIGVAISDSI